MSKGPHTHEWVYSEPKYISLYGKSGEGKFVAVKYCKYCLEVEELELHKKEDD